MAEETNEIIQSAVPLFLFPERESLMRLSQVSAHVNGGSRLHLLRGFSTAALQRVQCNFISCLAPTGMSLKQNLHLLFCVIAFNQVNKYITQPSCNVNSNFYESRLCFSQFIFVRHIFLPITLEKNSGCGNIFLYTQF